MLRPHDMSGGAADCKIKHDLPLVLPQELIYYPAHRNPHMGVADDRQPQQFRSS